jgi:hypothetical protein
MPYLPGDWLVFDKHLIMRPIGLIARGIDASYRHLTPILHPLYMPLDYVDTGLMLVAGHGVPSSGVPERRQIRARDQELQLTAAGRGRGRDLGPPPSSCPRRPPPRGSLPHHPTCTTTNRPPRTHRCGSGWSRTSRQPDPWADLADEVPLTARTHQNTHQK